MAKAKSEEVKQDTNAWMTTYTDLMTLLLTFFVLLLSISVIDSRKQRDALNSLVGAFGFKPGAYSVIGPEKGANVTVGSAPLTKEEIDFERLQNIIFKNGLEGDAKVKMEGERTIISLSDKVLFKSGSHTIEPGAKEFLLELASVMRGAPELIELRGYAHPSEIVFHGDPYQKSMYLSTRRALSVYHFMEAHGKIASRKLVAHGFGTRMPKRMTEQTTSHFNRQVEIICDYRAKIPFGLRRKSRRKHLIFDFKGFMFQLLGEQSS